MAMPTPTQSKTFNNVFFNSLFEGQDGERFKVCLQCATCSGACPYGYLMDFPPPPPPPDSLMIDLEEHE